MESSSSWHRFLPARRRAPGQPGAIASPNAVTRRVCRTVGLLFLRDDGVPFPVQVDLAAPEGPFGPLIDLGAGFRAAMLRSARPCWSGERTEATRADLRAALQEEEGLPREAKALMASL